MQIADIAENGIAGKGLRLRIMPRGLDVRKRSASGCTEDL
jgi:hypothetical protein